MYNATTQFFPQFLTFKMMEESVAREDVPSNRKLMEEIRKYGAIYDKSCHECKDQREIVGKQWLIRSTKIQQHPNKLLEVRRALRVLIFSNFLFLTYLITRTRASENWHSSRTFRSILQMKLLKIAPIRFAFRVNLSMPVIHIADVPATH